MIKAAQKDSLLLLAILLLAASARFYHLDFLSLWTDELWAIVDSQVPTLDRLIELIYQTETHPPGFHFLLHYWQLYVGYSDFILRFPSALAGVGVVWMTYLIGRAFFERHTAFIAATLTAVCYQLIAYSQEARANMLVAFFSLASLYTLLLILTERPSNKIYISFWISAAIASYLHYVGTVFIITLAMITSMDAMIKQSGYSRAIKLFLPVLILYAPWIPGTLHHLDNGPQELWNKTPTAATLPQTLEFLFGPDIFRTVLFSFGLLMGALTIRGRKDKRILVMLWLCMLVPIALFYGKSLISQPIYNHRHFLYALPLMYLVIADAASHILRKEKLLPTLIVIIAASLFLNQFLHLYDGDRYKHNYRGAVDIAMSGNPELMVASNRFFDHYVKQKGIAREPPLLFEDPTQLDKLSDTLTKRGVASFYYVEVIGPESDLTDDYLTREEALASRYTLECRNDLRRTRVLRFSTRKPKATTLEAPACHTSDGLGFSSPVGIP